MFFFPIPTPALDLFVFVEVGSLKAQANLQLVNIAKAGFELLILLPSPPFPSAGLTLVQSSLFLASPMES